MPTQLIQVDAFTDKPYHGNPAAVCLLSKAMPDSWLRDVANEMNLSETAFLLAEKDQWRLRWFTPAVEVDLCGHATLASAHVLWELGKLKKGQPARFLTRSGLLTATKSGAWIELDLPADPAEEAEAPAELVEALHTPIVHTAQGKFDYLVEVESEALVRELAPDIRLLGELTTRGISVTAPASTNGYDFVSRFFAPGAGIDEDPVTGSAHCMLGPWWSARLGKDTMTAAQISARGGVVHVHVGSDRVRLGGQAVTVLRGELA
ncbi:MAG: PhzF family phenazine biosynthesis protein [Gemmatimonadales bacterium]